MAELPVLDDGLFCCSYCVVLVSMEQQLTVVIYAINVSVASLLLTSISWHATEGA